MILTVPFRKVVPITLCLLSLASIRAADAPPEEPKPATPGLEGYTLSWSDEFEKPTLNTDEWVYRTDSKHWSTQRPENVSIVDGKLRIALKKESANGKDYTGGGVISKRTFKYGYYEARIKMPPGKGWHSAFWMQKHDGTGGTNPQASVQEIDVIENDSSNLQSYAVHLHQWKPIHLSKGGRSIKTPDLSADFHIYGCEFADRLIKFFFDGKLVFATSLAGMEPGEQHIWLTSIASFLGKTDAVDESTLPAEMQVDWVRFYSRNQ